MKKALSVLIAGCAIVGFAATPASLGNKGGQPLAGFAIADAAPTVAVVSGTVKDDRGVPLVGALVALIEFKYNGREIKSVATDKQGHFSAGIAPGTYRLRATATGFITGLTRVAIDRPTQITHNFALKRDDTLVQRRGDSDDYRWIARSVPRHAMNLREGEELEVVDLSNDRAEQGGPVQSFHGVAQFVAVGSSSRNGYPDANFFGTNFAVSGSLGNNVEMALIGQRGVGQLSPQRISAIATVRPGERHQVTATIGYGQVAFARKVGREIDGIDDPIFGSPLTPLSRAAASVSLIPTTTKTGSLDQLSVSATASWQVFQPLLVIYGFDYSRFIGATSRQHDSILPRFAVQYAPTARTRVNAAVTPGSDHQRESLDGFKSENIDATFQTSSAEIAFAGAPILDRSQRFETGIERLFGEGQSSIAASAFYDMISGHGVGVLALPLEGSPEMQRAFQNVAHQVTAMNGAARGLRMMYNRRFNDYASASVAYSFGRGEQLNNQEIATLSPAQLFKGGYFQVASAKLDLDFSHRTGTRISTVIRLSPSAVVFAIDPFAGQMSVYDPNINIYVTQELPNFGLPVRWQAIVDARNLLDQETGVEDGSIQLIATRSRRSVRTGLAFRW
ncbi:MAG: carboxypeptidase-like regulatory domain-containing protein [Acidobacteriota bacterium]|nr:carboxypeptidase-like regulatory domain-containing protein [Acidobacteriota bacterium]